ncbi:MAG: hypothetical protein ACM32E_05760 [Gemmatimonadota bacterium]
MEGVPEGTRQPGRRLPRLRMLLLGAVVAAYLVFRLVQGVLWLAGHL